MPNPVITAGRVGVNSITFGVAATTDADSILLTQLQAILAPSAGLSTSQQPLKQFLQGVYADSAAADTAFRAIGGEIVVRQTGGAGGTSTPVLTWTVAGSAITQLLIAWTGLAAGTLEMTIATRHSIPS
jgi:hypothetical protein